MFTESKDNTAIKKKRKNSSDRVGLRGRGEHSIRIFFSDYDAIVDHPVTYRKYIDEYFGWHGEVFPIGFSEGYKLHDCYGSKKYKGLKIRRVKLRNGEVYSIIPSDYMPYLIERTEDVSKGLLLRRWAVPYEVIDHVLGRNAMYWERAEEALGRISIVGSLCKAGELPVHLAADEKITWFNGKEAYVALTSGKDCALGADLSMSEDTQGLEESGCLTNFVGSFNPAGMI